MVQQIWIPKDCQHIREWLDDEVVRRNQQNEAGNKAWSQAFDDLGDYLAEDGMEDLGIAIFCSVKGGHPEPVPLHEWRKSRDKRGELTQGRIWRNLNVMGFGSGEYVCVAIRRDFRLPAPGEGEVFPPSSQARLGDAERDRFLRELNAEYQDKAAPGRDEVTRRGKEQHGDKWTRQHSERRNDLDATTGKPIYPNLYGVKSGPRRAG